MGKRKKPEEIQRLLAEAERDLAVIVGDSHFPRTKERGAAQSPARRNPSSLNRNHRSRQSRWVPSTRT
jgi:hypothetical protein